jgi:hypothetical protein
VQVRSRGHPTWPITAAVPFGVALEPGEQHPVLVRTRGQAGPDLASAGDEGRDLVALLGWPRGS